MELADGDRALAAICAPDPHDGVERVKRVRHVARIGGDALVAPAEDGVNSIEPFERPAARPRFPLVARHRRVVEVLAPRALQEVPAVGGHVAELSGRASDDRLREKRVVLAYERVVGGVRVPRQGADRDAATRHLDVGQLQAGKVHQLVGAFDVLLHQIEEVGAAGQEVRLRVRRDRARGGVRVGRAHVLKRPHRLAPSSPEPTVRPRRSATSAPPACRSGLPGSRRRSAGRPRSGRCCRSFVRVFRRP